MALKVVRLMLCDLYIKNKYVGRNVYTRHSTGLHFLLCAVRSAAMRLLLVRIGYNVIDQYVTLFL